MSRRKIQKPLFNKVTIVGVGLIGGLNERATYGAEGDVKSPARIYPKGVSPETPWGYFSAPQRRIKFD